MSADASFLDRLRQGKPEAWHALVAMFRQQLRDLAAATLPSEVAGRADASDMVQQTFCEANATFATFRGNSLSELFKWLTVILGHNVSDAVRQHVLAERRSVKLERRLDGSSQANPELDGLCAADQSPPSRATDREENRSRLLAALERLPPRQRAAVRLRHLEGRSLSDIAIELGCSKQAAAAVLARGLRAMRATLVDSDERLESDRARPR